MAKASCIQTVQRIASEMGYPLIDVHTCEYILWEHTGYPGFFLGDPQRALEAQIRAYLAGRKGKEPA